MKFSIKDLFSKSDQIRKKLRIWSNLLKKSLMKDFIFAYFWTVSSKKIVLKIWEYFWDNIPGDRQTFACLKSTIKTLGKCMKSIQS